MGVQHAIVLFPAFDATAEIETLRRAYDPQASLLPAHVTVVFPFADPGVTALLYDHVATSIAGMTPFDIALATPTREDGGYLFLRVAEGRDRVVELHERLYRGPLLAHRSVTHSYQPHVTVGHLESPEALRAAASAACLRLQAPLHARINEVAVFEIGAGVGRVVTTVPLNAPQRGEAGRTRSAPNAR